MILKLAGFVVAIAVALYGHSAFAQGSFFSSLSGTVVDSSGLVIPGATVKIVNKGTGSVTEAVTGSDGGFNVPSIQGGTYQVTVTLEGFKTKILESVTVNAALPATVRVELEVGVLSESVTVVGESATVVHATTPAISTNITGQQITSLPLSSRNALDSLTGLAGFNTSGTARNSTVTFLRCSNREATTRSCRSGDGGHGKARNEVLDRAPGAGYTAVRTSEWANDCFE